jgi:hypothetical protein
MDDSAVSKIDDLWVQHFAKSMASLTGGSQEDLRKGVEGFEKAAVKAGAENAKKGPVTQYRIEAAAGGKLMLATAMTPVKVKVSALNASGIAVADFTGKLTLRGTGASLTPAESVETAAFVAGVLENIELKFKLPNGNVTLTAEGGGVTTTSAPFAVLALPGSGNSANGKQVAQKTEKARAVLAKPPANPGSAALAELRKMRPVAGLNDAPKASPAANQIGSGSVDDKENCGAVTLGAICGTTSTQLVEQMIRTRLGPAVRQKVALEFPQLSGQPLEAKYQERLDALAGNFNCIQNQSVYWRTESLENLRHNFYPESGEIPKGMPTDPKGEECGESQLAATRELLVAEAKRRNEGGGIGGVKYKVIQDGMNDTDPALGKFYDLQTQELQKQMGKYPDGTQFQVFLTGPGFAGHWVYAEKYNGQVVIEDYQKAGAVAKKGATAYTDGDAPHSPVDDKPGVFEKGMFIALAPDTADEKAIGAWSENPMWPQGGVPSKVAPTKVVEPEVIATPQTDVLDAVNGGKLAGKVTDPAFRKGLIAFLDKPGDVDETMAKKLLAGYREAPETDSELRELIFKKAFGCKINSMLDGKRSAVPPKVLTKMVDILETLPRDHLPPQWELVGATGTTKTSGSWDPDNKKATFDYGADDAPGFDQAYDNAKPGDALDGTKCFDVMVRHEVGHSVHSDKGGEALTDSADGGSWQRHGPFANVVDAISGLMDDFGGRLQTIFSMPSKPGADAVKEKIRGLSQESLKEMGAFKKALGAAFATLPGIEFPPTATGLQQRQEHVAGLLPMDHDLLKVIFQGGRLMPYFELGDAPIAVGGRVYLNAENADGWVSFDAASYAHKISIYQYRSPSEWFAEFYAGINNGSESVRKKVGGKYPKARAWLKSNKLLLYPDE